MSTEEAAVRPIEVTPEAPRVIPEVKVPATRPEAEPKPPVEVKPAVYTRKHKQAARNLISYIPNTAGQWLRKQKAAR